MENTKKIEITKNSSHVLNNQIVSKFKKATHKYISGGLYNYSLIFSFLAVAILFILVFNLPSTTKLFGFYKFTNGGDPQLSFFGIIAILIFIFQVLSNLHYIVRFSLQKQDQKKKIGYICLFAFILLLSCIIFIFGMTNKPGTIDVPFGFSAWIYEFHFDPINSSWIGFQYTQAGLVLVWLTMFVYLLGVIATWIFLKTEIKVA